MVCTAGGSAHADQGILEANTKSNGPTLSFDGPAVQIGVGSYEEGPTGLTIIHFKNRASVAVDVRGGAPGTVNTDGLRNGYGAAFTDAIVLTGGSAYGEEAITAVATGLKDLGLRAGDWYSVAFAAGAVIYDLGNKRLAHAALRACGQGSFLLGRRGLAGWQCREAILDALPTPAREERTARLVLPRSPPSWL
jgi:hypothetical protein